VHDRAQRCLPQRAAHRPQLACSQRLRAVARPRAASAAARSRARARSPVHGGHPRGGRLPSILRGCRRWHARCLKSDRWRTRRAHSLTTSGARGLETRHRDTATRAGCLLRSGRFLPPTRQPLTARTRVHDAGARLCTRARLLFVCPASSSRPCLLFCTGLAHVTVADALVATSLGRLLWSFCEQDPSQTFGVAECVGGLVLFAGERDVQTRSCMRMCTRTRSWRMFFVSECTGAGGVRQWLETLAGIELEVRSAPAYNRITAL
jgi:hypothetical protein